MGSRRVGHNLTTKQQQQSQGLCLCFWDCLSIKTIRAGLSLDPTTFTGASNGDMGEGLLCGFSQTLELPATEGQAGPIFVVLPQAGDLSLQGAFSLVVNCLGEVLKYGLYFVILLI